jgi:hypothetical protein
MKIHKHTVLFLYKAALLAAYKLFLCFLCKKKLAKDIFTIKKGGAKRHQQIFSLQSSIPACPDTEL